MAVAIDKDSKGSRYALKWAADSLLTRGQTVVLIHVLHTTSPHVTSNYLQFSINMISPSYLMDLACLIN